MTIAYPYNSPVGAKARMDRTRFTDAFASGSIAFAAQPTADDTIAIAGTTVTFKATGAAGNQSNIGADAGATLEALVTMLKASADANLKKCKYAHVAGAKAAGNIAFAGQPTANDTVTLGGTAVTFVAGTPTGNQVKIGADLAATLLALAAFLKASTDANLVEFDYSVDATKLYVTAKAAGVAGNALTLAASAATASGATLSGGSELLLVTAAVAGSDGNALTLAASVATASGATLAGGTLLRQKWKDREATNRYEPLSIARWANRMAAARWAWTPGAYYPS